VDGNLNGEYHIPVFSKEVIKYLRSADGGTFVDATLGEGGHALEILRSSEHTRVIGFDWDDEILRRAERRLRDYKERVVLIHENFVSVGRVLQQMRIETVDGLLFDLGVSSWHLQQGDRGFSFQHDGPLDMRMDRRKTRTAHQIVNQYPVQQIESMLRRYGEERRARRIAAAIEQRRQRRTIETTGQLAHIVSGVIPKRHQPHRMHPATKTFLALRIAVNEELKAVEETLKQSPALLKRGGRICVISFHSLEDRIVKESFRALEKPCTCPPSLPQCICGGQRQVLKIITKKPLTPRCKEVKKNIRARSAKLRVAERV